MPSGYSKIKQKQKNSNEKTSSQTAKRGWNIKNAHNTAAAAEETTREHHHGLCSEYGIGAGWKMKLTGWKVGAENHRLNPPVLQYRLQYFASEKIVRNSYGFTH